MSAVNQKMSKTQTKINFVEKKKTSARLQEAFFTKEKKAISETKNETNLILKSPLKNVIKETNSYEPCNLSDKCTNKENKVKIQTSCVKNPFVFLLRSPSKNIETRKEVKETEERYSLRSSPLKRSSPSKIKPDAGESSPPKKECIQNETPSQLITKLVLESPERQQKVHSRKELFPKGELDEACKALHSSAPTELPGREDKLEFIKEYLLGHARHQSSGTLYISGPPGTGKTACVNLAVEDPQVTKGFKVICLNCTTMKSCGSVYNRIASELKLKSGKSEKTYLKAIERYLESSNRKMLLIVLDELDQLCSSKQSILYSILEWGSRADSRVVLVGIANALDLTDRVLPRLQARLTTRPTLLHFPSYTRQQIVHIITTRLSQAGVEDVFSGPTLQLLAGKVAAVNGDVRRALDIARRVVEVAERRIVLQPLSDNGSTRQTVALQEVLGVVNDVYNTAQTLESSGADSFPLQQKLLICSLLLIRQTSKAKDVTVGKLHEVYKKVCERRNMSALDISEFLSLTSLVEARGILRVVGKNQNRLSKVILQWDEAEVKAVLQDKQLLAAVLMDKGVTT